jgi:DNA mismatch repair protein MutS
VLVSKQKRRLFNETFGEDFHTFYLEDWVYQTDYAYETLIKHFDTKTLKGFGIEDLYEGIIASGSILHYLGETQHHKLEHITSIARIAEDDYVWMDKFTITNLELYNSTNNNAVTLLHVIDKTISPMGGRMLKRWLALPLKNTEKIKQRHEVVSFLSKENKVLQKIQDQIKHIGDLERLISKVATGKVNPREVIQLKNSLEAIVPIKLLASNCTNESLKIASNNVFGYYIEVRNTHKDKVPEEWIRKQTLVSAERYITEELKEYEAKILGAEDRIQAIEQQLFSDLVSWMNQYIKPVQQNAYLIGQIDCLCGFAQLAKDNKYTYPTIDDSFDLDIKDGRHPVIEKQLPIGEAYIANDVFLDRTNQQIIMITGPNMSGKSAILRQTALIVLLAQIGSFVPAKSARIGLVDKIFTRVGASDNISMGESTFMVEMNETASILNNISDRSLVLLDEIGRGTSTYDGISIAWAISEYLHEHPAKPKTLFATHYHELNEMTETFSRIKNYNVSVKELKDNVLFLRKLVEGGSAHSFGIHVAKMAGMPPQVLHRANKILKKLEQSHSSEELTDKVKSMKDEMQLSFFNLDDPLLENIKEEILHIDIDTLTPVEALMKLNEIKRMLVKKKQA